MSPIHRRPRAAPDLDRTPKSGRTLRRTVSLVASAITIAGMLYSGTAHADARTEACDLAVVTVEPGSPSQANVQRRVFSPLYSRLVLAREA